MIQNGVIRPVELISDDVPVGRGHPLPVSQGLSLPPHDYVGLFYTGPDLTHVEFRVGGSLGSIVASLDLTYAGGLLATVTKTP